METNLNGLLSIDHSSEKGVIQSFERISNELLNNYSLVINNITFLFTEIEFYYYHSVNHKDKNTHRHDYQEGRWRFHGSGLDITFKSNIKENTNPEFYGGILIRGLKQIDPTITCPYVNGPLRSLVKIFHCMNNVTSCNSGLILLKRHDSLQRKIHKTSRHGVGPSPYEKSDYRYFTEQKEWNNNQWDGKHLSTKDEINNQNSWKKVN